MHHCAFAVNLLARPGQRRDEDEKEDGHQQHLERVDAGIHIGFATKRIVAHCRSPLAPTVERAQVATDLARRLHQADDGEFYA